VERSGDSWEQGVCVGCDRRLEMMSEWLDGWRKERKKGLLKNGNVFISDQAALRPSMLLHGSCISSNLLSQAYHTIQSPDVLADHCPSIRRMVDVESGLVQAFYHAWIVEAQFSCDVLVRYQVLSFEVSVRTPKSTFSVVCLLIRFFDHITTSIFFFL
jgi:hypothetical protein